MNKSIMDETFGITENLLKNLSDKSTEKRKQATSELQKLSIGLLKDKNEKGLFTLIGYFKKSFIESSLAAQKKAGLLAFGSIAIAISQNGAPEHLGMLISPVIKCFKDEDSKVRYTACETVYNIIKVAREAILFDLNNIFHGLIQLMTDMQDDVRRAAHALDTKLKEIVSESLIDNKFFDLNALISIICDKLTALHPTIRQMLVTWIDVLDSIPNVNLLQCLPRFLKQLFQVLGDKNKDVQHLADQRLTEFLREFRKYAGRNVELDQQILQTLLEFMQKKEIKENICRLTAMDWVYNFLFFFKEDLKKQEMDISKNNSEVEGEDSSSIIAEEIKNMARNIFPELVSAVLFHINDQTPTIYNRVSDINGLLMTLLEKVMITKEHFGLLIQKLVKRLNIKIGEAPKLKTKQLVIEWLILIINNHHEVVFEISHIILQHLIETLDCQKEELVEDALQLLGLMAHNYQNYFEKIVDHVLQKFYASSQFMLNKASSIVSKFCLFQDPVKLFIIFAEIVATQEQDEKSSDMIYILNNILVTDKALAKVRFLLTKNEEGSEESNSLFTILYKTWCLNPVSALTLCLLAQRYRLAFSLINKFGLMELETTSFIHLGNLVQLIESPNFAFLRLQLLNYFEFPYLLKCLQGLLMLLPQGKAFFTLRTRLKCISLAPPIPKPTSSSPRRSTLQLEDNIRTFSEGEIDIEKENINDKKEEEEQMLLSFFSNIHKRKLSKSFSPGHFDKLKSKEK